MHEVPCNFTEYVDTNYDGLYLRLQYRSVAVQAPFSWHVTEGVPSVLVLGLQVYILVVPSTVLPMLMVDRGMLGGSRQSAVRSKLQNVKRIK